MSGANALRIEMAEPSEKLIEAANMVKKIPGVKVRTLVREGTSYQVLEISGIKNAEFEPLVSGALSGVHPYGREELFRIIEVIRWIDPILSEFKDKYYGEPPQEYFVDFGKIVDSSCTESGEIHLEIGSLREPASKEHVEFVFIEELIHHMQFHLGDDPESAVTEDKVSMVRLAWELLGDSWIPSRYEELREQFKP